MATNTGEGHRNGAIKKRSQMEHPNGLNYKRDTDTGQFMDCKTSGGKVKGVRTDK